jgi:hypothetical protein
MARKLAPKGIHDAHFVYGSVRNAEKGRIEGAARCDEGQSGAHSTLLSG